MRSRAVGLLVGVLADALFADPARWHPVAGFGSCAAALERRWYADRRAAGVAHTVVLVGAVAGVGVAAEVVGRRRPVAHACLTAVATWAVLGGTSLAAHGTALADALEGESAISARRVGDVDTGGRRVSRAARLGVLGMSTREARPNRRVSRAARRGVSGMWAQGARPSRRVSRAARRGELAV